MVSFTHPHDPYVARKRFWDVYEGSANLEPKVGPIAFEKQDPHSKRLMLACDYARFHVRDDDVRRSRRAYFANVSYLDEKVGELVDSLRRTRMLDETTIVLLRRPWRHAWRAWALVQDELFRGLVALSR
jgi:choline-sulfatase